MISVVIPVFNGAAYVTQAIESVLDQTLLPAEVVVVDDGSSDSTAEVVQRYPPPVHYRRQTNQGPGAARNLGIRESKGEFLAFLDSDDLWLPEKLRLQKALLDENPELDLVFCNMSQFRSPEFPADVTAGSATGEAAAQPSTLISCMLARRRAFDRVGPLRTDLKAEFVEWYGRAQEAGLQMQTLDVLLVKRRIHPGNFTLKHRDIRLEYLQTLKASLDRRRAKVNANTAAGGL
jgi:glycosyltransferase involved in cell wall biosynthesis